MHRPSRHLGLLAGLMIAGTCYGHSFPAKAVSLKSSLVQGYPQCTTPDTMTTGGRPACLATDELDPGCVFGSKGTGSLTAKISKTSIKLSTKLKGIDPLCEGTTLTPSLTVRTTTDDCANDHCTVMDYEVSSGSCVVKNGKCSVSGAVATGYPAGAGSEMTVVTCGVKVGRQDGLHLRHHGEIAMAIGRFAHGMAAWEPNRPMAPPPVAVCQIPVLLPVESDSCDRLCP